MNGLLQPTPQDKRLRSIDMLRGIAILLVLAIHIPHYAPGGWRENPWFIPAFLAEFGYMGVPLFIVISGFCIHRAAALAKAAQGKYSFSWPSFWKRRFIRLYPPYVAAIAVSLACAAWLHSRVPQPQFTGWDLGTHLLLLHNLTHEFATSLGNGAFWSLGTEEQLYALYALLLLLMIRGSTGLVLCVAAVVTVAWRLIGPMLPDPGIDLGRFHLGSWYQWPLHYWLHWTLGAIAVDAWLGNRRLPDWSRSLRWAAGLLLLGLLCNRTSFELLLHSRLEVTPLRAAGPVFLTQLHNMGELAALGGCFCLLNAGVAREREQAFAGLAAFALAWVGRISYSLYLVHVPVIYVLEERLPIEQSAIGWPLRYLSYGAAAILAGFLFHHAVERWFLHGRLPGTGSQRAALAEGTS